MHIYTYTYIYIYIYTYIHTYIYTHIHTYYAFRKVYKKMNIYQILSNDSVKQYKCN